jgi:hypothetical protein
MSVQELQDKIANGNVEELVALIEELEYKVRQSITN